MYTSWSTVRFSTRTVSTPDTTSPPISSSSSSSPDDSAPPTCRLPLRVHDLVGLIFRQLGQIALEGTAVTDNLLCPSARLLIIFLAISVKLNSAFGSGAVFVDYPLMPHRIMLVRTGIHDKKALARYRNSRALRPSMRPIHSRDLPNVGIGLTNFLSGSTPPKSAKRKRLEQRPKRKKFGNAAKKKISSKGKFFFGG